MSSPRSTRRRFSTWAICLALVWQVGGVAPATAQMGPVLNNSYYANFSNLYNGDYATALRNFEGELSGSMKIGTQRWLDSVCYLTMIGECHYRMGNLDKAVEAYGAALNLYVEYSNWMLSVQFPPNVQSVPHPKFPWGIRAGASKLARLPETMLMQQGQQITAQTLQQGGVVSPPKLISVPVQEIIRCTVLALKRRGELLGPVGPHDNLNNFVLDKLQTAGGAQNSWARAWSDAQLGAAMYAVGNKGQAIAYLKSSLLLGGELDHPLTCYSMLMLGQIAFSEGKYDDAGLLFGQATLSAAEQGDYPAVEEAFRYSFLIHVLLNRKGVFMETAPATAWAKRVGGRELQTSLLVLAAESAAIQRATKQSAALLAEAWLGINRTGLATGEVGQRYYYTSAIVDYQSGKLAEGDKSIAACMSIATNHSKWLYQLAVTTSRFTSTPSTLTESKVLPIYERLSDDPLAADWAERPVDSLLSLMIPRQPTFDIWFELILGRNESEKAFDIADKSKRHRFFNALPLGGRPLAVRWLLEAPVDSLDKESQLQRQDLLVRYPQFTSLAQQAAKLKTDLAAVPYAPEKPEDVKKQSELMAEWYRVAADQEGIVREIALRREPTKLVFPPSTNLKTIQSQLPQGHVALIAHATSRNLHAILISKTRYANWRIENPALMEKKILNMLRAMGNFDGNRELTVAQLGDPAWKAAARDAVDTLLANSKVNFGQAFEELVIVPDGMLWYLPFEAVQVTDGTGPAASLIGKTRIRYAPTQGLIFNTLGPRARLPQTAFVAGKLHPRGDGQMTAAAVAKIVAKDRQTHLLKPNTSVASPLYGGLFDQLVVLDDLNVTEKGPLDWSPLNLDRAPALGALNNWMQLPWKRFDVAVMPGFHTAAETTVRNASLGNGQEMFLGVCGLMSHGARTVMLTRWRPGGASSVELVRRFLEELPYGTASQAWQRSVRLIGESPLEIAGEPRVRGSANDPEMKADAPFFWAPFMLFDRGAVGAETPAPVVVAAPPVAERPAAPAKPAVPKNPLDDVPVAENPVPGALGGDPGKVPPAAKPPATNRPRLPAIE